MFLKILNIGLGQSITDIKDNHFLVRKFVSVYNVMECTITRRKFLSRIRPEYDTNYYRIVIRENGRRIYEKLLNPIYDLDDFLNELRKTYKFSGIAGHDHKVQETPNKSVLPDAVGTRPPK